MIHVLDFCFRPKADGRLWSLLTVKVSGGQVFSLPLFNISDPVALLAGGAKDIIE
jgi:hypothetical protein